MSKIAIHGAVSNAFSLYFHHILLIAMAGVIVGTASWASVVGPRYIAKSMGIYQEIPEVTISMDEDADAQQTVTRVVESVNQKITVYMDNSSKGMLFLLFIATLILWFISSFLHLGFMKLVLQLVDKNKSDIHTLLSVKDVYPSYIGGTILYALYALVIMIGASIVFVPVFRVLSKLSNLAMFSGVLVAMLVMVGVWGYLIRYIMYAYCIIDKRTSARESLHMSARVTAGERVHLFIFLLVITLVLGVIGGLIKTIFCFRCSDLSMQGMLYMVGIAATVTPLTMLMFAKVYRQLGGK